MDNFQGRDNMGVARGGRGLVPIDSVVTKQQMMQTWNDRIRFSCTNSVTQWWRNSPTKIWPAVWTVLYGPQWIVLCYVTGDVHSITLYDKEIFVFFVYRKSLSDVSIKFAFMIISYWWSGPLPTEHMSWKFSDDGPTADYQPYRIHINSL